MTNTNRAFGMMAYCRGALNTLTSDIDKAKIALDSREPDDIALDIGLAAAMLDAALLQLIKVRRVLQSAQKLIAEETVEQADTWSIKEAADALEKHGLIREQEPCEDAISRQAVDELSKELVHTTRDKADFLCNFWEGLQKLPSVTPQPKTGRWIRVDKDKLRCSECEIIHLIAQYPNGKIDWCPNCGAKMIELLIESEE